MSGGLRDPVPFRVVAVFDTNNGMHMPRTHLVRPEAAAHGGPFFTACDRRVVGLLLEDPNVAQVPCPRCGRLAVVR